MRTASWIDTFLFQKTLAIAQRSIPNLFLHWSENDTKQVENSRVNMGLYRTISASFFFYHLIKVSLSRSVGKFLARQSFFGESYFRKKLIEVGAKKRKAIKVCLGKKKLPLEQVELKNIKIQAQSTRRNLTLLTLQIYCCTYSYYFSELTRRSSAWDLFCIRL